MVDELRQHRITRLFDRLEKELLELSPERRTAITDFLEYQAMSETTDEHRRELTKQRQQRYRDRMAQRRRSESRVNVCLVLPRALVEKLDAKAATAGQPGDPLMLRRSAIVEAALADSAKDHGHETGQ